MKSSLLVRYHYLVLALMLAPALSITTMNPLRSDPAATNAPTGAAPSADIDAASGKPIVTTPSGLKYVDLKVGDGPAVKQGDHVVVNYVGTLTDGKKFDSSYDRNQPFDYIQGVTSLIPGWTEGTSTMKVGGKRKLIIPPNLGYGLEGAGDAIPPNATLIFEIELVSIQPN